MITAFLSEGSGWPVLIRTAWPLSNRRVSGHSSLAPKVSSARTARPSMAAEWNEGEEKRALTGPAVTRPQAERAATVSASVRRSAKRSRNSCRASERERICR